MARVGVEAGGLAGGGLVGAGRAGGLGGLAGGGDVVARVGVEAGGGVGGAGVGVVGARRAGGLGGRGLARWCRRSGPRRRRGRWTGRWMAGRCRPAQAVWSDWPGGGDVVARVGVEAGGLAGGRLVGAGRAGGLGGLAG